MLDIMNICAVFFHPGNLLPFLFLLLLIQTKFLLQSDDTACLDLE